MLLETEVAGTLASPNESEREGGLSPPPSKRPRLLTRASEDQGGPSSSRLSSEPDVEERGDLAVASERSSSAACGVTTEGPSETAMQANGVVENGTTTSGIAVNGLGGGLVSGKKRENGVVCDGVEVMGVARHVKGELPTRRAKPRQQLSGKDEDIIRLIGQHLRELGFW